ncbi:hypothetical protein AB4Z22_10060 [Paenibacillus sp. TAF58]
MINDGSRKRKLKSRSMGVIVLLTAAAVLASACSAPGAKGAATVQLAPKAIKTDVIKKQKISNPIEQVADIAAGTTLDVVSALPFSIRWIKPNKRWIVLR